MIPTDDKERKEIPIWTGVFQYFPDIWQEIAIVSRLGNEQHNPGQPLHWSREKSSSHLDSAIRHMLDYAAAKRRREIARDKDGAYHLAKGIWRLGAEFQVSLEAEKQ